MHGFPQDGKVTDDDYKPYVTKEMVDEAHQHGITVIPWTVDDEPTMNKLIDDGVDGLITDYPDRLREVLADRGFALPAAYDTADQAEPLQQAHAHNDYEHKRPLQDALDHGFTSVEADVWLVDGQLLVAHDRDQGVPGRTLESLYLSPLEARRKMNGGTEYPGWDGNFQLLIDVKSDAGPTWAAIDQVLREHPNLMTTFTPSEHQPGCGHRGHQRQPGPRGDARPADAVRRVRRPARRPGPRGARVVHAAGERQLDRRASPGTAPARCRPPRSRSCATS